MEKRCRVCNEILTKENWYASDRKDNHCWCKICHLKYQRESYTRRSQGLPSPSELRRKNPTCRICGDPLTKDNWSLNLQQKSHRRFICKVCSRILAQQYGKTPKRRKSRRESSKLRHQSMWEDAFKQLGDTCACCGESYPEFLTIDHINSKSSDEKKKQSSSIRQAWKEGFPKDKYQILCWNCNCAKGLRGGCPHKKEPIWREFKCNIEALREQVMTFRNVIDVRKSLNCEIPSFQTENSMQSSVVKDAKN